MHTSWIQFFLPLASTLLINWHFCKVLEMCNSPSEPRCWLRPKAVRRVSSPGTSALLCSQAQESESTVPASLHPTGLPPAQSQCPSRGSLCNTIAYTGNLQAAESCSFSYWSWTSVCGLLRRSKRVEVGGLPQTANWSASFPASLCRAHSGLGTLQFHQPKETPMSWLPE